MLKLAFLFLTIGNVYHEEHWKDFFRGYEKFYSVYVHAKEEKTVTSPFFKPHLISEHVPTSWANTMKAQIALLKEALKDPHNAKFIFLSESTIPLQDFSLVYKTVNGTPKSMFKVQPNPHLHSNSFRDVKENRMVPGIPFKYQQKHTQWIVLNRKHASILVSAAHHLNKRRVFCDNEHYPGTVLANKSLLRELVPVDTTYVNWYIKGPNGKTPFTFSNLKRAREKELAVLTVKRGYLFARKFAPRCNLKELDAHLSYRKKSTAQSKAPPTKPKKAKKIT